jgi:hypothetical protein
MEEKRNRLFGFNRRRVEPDKINTKEDFAKYKEALVATSTKSTDTTSSLNNIVRESYTLEEIYQSIQSGNPADLVLLSQHYYRTSGIYKSSINYYSSLLLYYMHLTPFMLDIDKVNDVKFTKAYNAACYFMDRTFLNSECQHIVATILKNGIYFGLFREFTDGYAIQDLPYGYCRTYYKNDNNINLVELNMAYFDTIRDNTKRKESLNSYPKDIQKAYNKYSNTKTEENKWYLVSSKMGMAFYFEDKVPFFIGSIPSTLQYDFSEERETNRDEKNLKNLLIQEMPFDTKSGKSVYTLPEMAELHAALGAAFSENPDVDVAMTPGQIKLETFDSSTQASQDNTEKYKRAIYDKTGISSNIFNATGSNALKYSVNKDTSIMWHMVKQISDWLGYQINQRFGTNKFDFDVEILPVTLQNQKEMIDTYLKTAQFGFDKLIVSVAKGTPQSRMVGLQYLENVILDLPSTLLPLQSSHTQDGDSSKKVDEKGEQNGENGNKNNSGGRKTLEDNEKDQRTLENNKE